MLVIITSSVELFGSLKHIALTSVCNAWKGKGKVVPVLN